MMVNLLFLNNISVNNSLASQLCRNACQMRGSVSWGWNLIKESVGLKWHRAFPWCLREPTHRKQYLGTGRVSYLFYWFSICEALHIYTVCDCTQLITQDGNQIANPITCYCDYITLCCRRQSMCHSMGRALLKKCRHLLAVLPMKHRSAEQYHLISPQCSSQACQPDSPQSPRIITPGLLQPSDSTWSCYLPF